MSEYKVRANHILPHVGIGARVLILDLLRDCTSQKEEIDRLMGVNQNLEIYLSESKAITELAVKGLEEVASGKDWSHIMAQKAKVILEEIARLSQ